MIGFDADHRTNQHVCRQLGRLIAARLRDTAQHGVDSLTTIVVWDGPKGIDDAALQNVALTKITVPNWLTTLSATALEEVKNIWQTMGFELPN
jgi:hypothetical protein